MNKKIICTIISSSIFFSGLTAFASPYSTLPVKLNDISPSAISAEDITDAEVSLSLSAGSTVMTLNGEDIEITAPYVTGDGVTLVPVRVITEAFGAEVTWAEAEQAVYISYEEVNLKLVIGSKAAVINDHAEELESAPELKDGTTMVPLRFISETFGAKVNYDNESGIITVTLTNSEEAEMIRGMHDKEFIGDSYLGWSMRTPRGMNLSYRSFDGESISFVDEYSNRLYIYIDEREKTPDIISEYQSALSSSYYNIISAAERGTDSFGNPKFSITEKSDYMSEDSVTIIKGNTVYSVTLESYTSGDDANAKAAYDDLKYILSTFALTTKEDMYDFSDVKEGMREYENEELKLSFSVPNSYTEDYTSVLNEISFISKDEEVPAGISVKIYSKTKTTSKESFAQTQHDIDKSVFNPDLITVSELSTTPINGTDAACYIVKGGPDDYKFITKKLFFELGEYIYILSVMEASEESCQTIIDSFKAEAIDEEEFGSVLRRLDLMEGYTYDSYEFSFKLPKYWSSSYYSIDDERSGSSILEYSSLSEDEEYLEELIDEIKSVENVVITDPLKWHEGPGGRYPEITIKEEVENGPDNYITINGKVIGNKIVILMFGRNELYYGGVLESEFESILNSAEKLKEK